MSALLEELAEAPEVQPGTGIGPGTVIGGRFEVLRELGRGGFGVVFEARDRELGRLVAVKVVRPRRGVDRRMLRSEAEAAAALHHPNIVTVHDLGSDGGEGWLVLELLRGETLEERLRRGPLPGPEALRVATEVARGLAHAHHAGVLHRDLKPSNVFLCDDGAVKILDFGLSRVFGSGSGPEGGTPAYMAPEQWRREAEDERTDVFALGVMFHEMLTGNRPFAVESGRSRALDDGPVPELPSAAAPRNVRALIRRSMSRAQDDRPRDGAAVLETLLEQRTATDAGRSRRRVVLAGALVGLVALVAVFASRALQVRDLAPGQRIPVAVADFQNGTSDPELNGLSGMLTTSLEQSKRLTVLTRSRLADLIRQTGREVPERIDESLAREVGKSAGVKALLLATVHRFDDLYAIEMRALDPAGNDEYLFTLKTEGRGKSSIPGMIDRLSAQTRERLRDQPADLAGGRAVADVTTANLAAYEHYFRARQAMDAWQADAAMRELEAALRIDPQFALAHYQRAVLDAWTPVWIKASNAGDEASVRTMQEHLLTAMKLADRLPEKERLALLGWKATLDKRPAEALRLRDQAAEAYPQDKEAVFWAGDVRFHQGDRAAAVPFFQRAVTLDPDYALALDHLAWSYDALGMPRPELEASRRWLEVSHSADAGRWVGRALLSLDRRDEAEDEFRKAFAIDGRQWPSSDLASWLAFHGRAHDAEAMAREGLAVAGKRAGGTDDVGRQGDLGGFVRLLVNTLGQQGQLREARAVVDGLASAGVPAIRGGRRAPLLRDRHPLPGTGARGRRRGRAVRAPQVRPDAARLRFRAGDGRRRARRPGDGGAGPGRPGLGRDRGRPAAGLRHVARLAGGAARRTRRPGSAPTRRMLSVSQRYSGLHHLGAFLIGQGRDAEGVASLEKARAIGWFRGTGDSHPWLHPEGLLLLAGAYERLGERQKGLERVDELLRIWQRADPDLPRLAEARALKKRLAPRTAQATQR